MEEFCTCVPGPAVYAVEAPSCWPGIAMLGTELVVATAIVAGRLWMMGRSRYGLSEEIDVVLCVGPFCDTSV